MKNIKNLFKAMFLFSLAFFIACDDDEYEVPGSFVDLSITMTSGASATRESTVNGFFSFSDLSAGAIEQEWRIPESAFFLEGPIPNNLDNHDEYIINPGETVSTDKTVHIMWTEGDTLTKVGYYGVFPDSTSFRFPAYWDSDLGEAVEDTIQTNFINGQWIAEYEFTIDVYDSVVATPEVRTLDETVIDHENTASITLNFGDQLIFEDLSGLIVGNTSRPNTTRWRVRTTEENEDDRTSVYTSNTTRLELDERVLDTITFDELGDYRVELLATRERTERLRVNEDEYIIPTIITVIPLAEDLVIDSSLPVTERDDDRIAIFVSSPLAPSETSPSANFDVKVDGTSVPVESVTFSSRTSGGEVVGGIINLTLDIPLVPTDASKTVTVSYDGQGGITSRDLRPLQAFPDTAIEVYVPTPMVQTGDAVGSSDQKILIPFDQDIDPASISGATDATAGFTVTLNGGAGTVSNVAVNADNANMLEISLAESVYSDDTITVAYTGPGEILSVGGGAINDFSAIAVTPYGENIFPVNSFDTAGFWKNVRTDGSMLTFIDPTPVIIPSGASNVAYMNDPAGTKTHMVSSDNPTTLEPGDYMVKYSFYLNAAHASAEKLFVDGGVGEITTTLTNRWATSAKGTWVETEATFTVATGGDFSFRLQGIPAPISDLYIDDFQVLKVALRP
ncbi:putative repeat protein (TIGR02059 family) [Maribacter vaceletii]|uniref:Putative repeat protein (TIGR02059 family) n=1 Tax=Maribacter vaceletii TaxID=1206816 RepID=A0A495E963_9FLAO|nr:SwmB domain-containing protein [Maribacter vaceletii]RKR13474.1 putative repeat protein (TIGR02059 family) [Maribacter vaceletii]